MLDNIGNILAPPQGADYNPDDFIKYLQSGITAYKNK